MKVDYTALVHLILDPLIGDPQLLKLDQEILVGGERVLIRIALEGGDRGRILGRGGRNIHALRHVLHAAGNLSGQQIHLEFFGGHALEEELKPLNSLPPKERPQPARSPGAFRARRTRSRAHYT
ncbi:MAG: KH domain-containing protein [Prochlorotrichaceae cyanobacterium]|jgi:predicted RNA-binding protein YlqC (UPF0109 family)